MTAQKVEMMNKILNNLNLNNIDLEMYKFLSKLFRSTDPQELCNVIRNGLNDIEYLAALGDSVRDKTVKFLYYLEKVNYKGLGKYWSSSIALWLETYKGHEKFVKATNFKCDYYEYKDAVNFIRMSGKRYPLKYDESLDRETAIFQAVINKFMDPCA